MKCKECEKAIKKAEGFQPCYEAAIAAQAARCKKHKKEKVSE